MEMCYDGTLVMPANYAVVSEDEMTYVDGGWDIDFSVKKSACGIPKGVTVYFTGTVSEMAWVAASTAALAGILGACSINVPLIGPYLALKSVQVACGIAALAATIVATNDKACSTRFTVEKYLGI